MNDTRTVQRPFHETAVWYLDRWIPYLQSAGQSAGVPIRTTLALIDDTAVPPECIRSIVDACRRVADRALVAGQDDVAEMATATIKHLNMRAQEAAPIICDGCNVRDGWEHKCHGKNAMVQGERTSKLCECRPCAFAHLLIPEQEKLACANYLGIDPQRISEVKTAYDGGGHFTGLTAIICISTGHKLAAWVRDNLPKPNPNNTPQEMGDEDPCSGEQPRGAKGV